MELNYVSTGISKKYLKKAQVSSIKTAEEKSIRRKQNAGEGLLLFKVLSKSPKQLQVRGRSLSVMQINNNLSDADSYVTL